MTVYLDPFAYASLSAAPATTQNDYAPTGWSTAYATLSVALTASCGINGLTGGIAGREVTIVNSSTDFLLWLTCENTNSTAANRFTLPNNLPAFLCPGDEITLRYSTTTSRWRVKTWPAQGAAMGLTEFSDFIGGTGVATAAGPFSAQATGTDASFGSGTNISANRAIGATALNTGSTATGRATVGGLGAGGVSPTLGWALGVSRLSIATLPDGTETYSVYTGFGDSSGGTLTDGTVWELWWNGSAAEWSLTRADGAVLTRTASVGLVPDTTANWLVVFVNAAWTRADFIYSADSMEFVKEASPTTGLPNATTELFGFLAGSIIKSAGTTSRSMEIDLAGVRVSYTRN